MQTEISQKIDSFAKENIGNSPIITVFGPTACGKTGLAIEIAKQIDSEVISVDARQIYREMDIGTAKASQEEMDGIVHHMIDIINPDEDFSVVDFRNQASQILENIWKKGKIPILCGGTGLYLDSLLFKRNYSRAKKNTKRRQELEAIRQNKGDIALWHILETYDKKYADSLHPNDKVHIIRAIEIYEETGKSKQQIDDGNVLIHPTLFLSPYDGNREKLYEKINLRVEIMRENGLIEEVQKLLKKYPKNAPGLATIGYKEVIEFLDGEILESEMIQKIQQNSRRYAKRQICWNKKYMAFL
ncbi:tRNA (adenosine(37)-N6)-dimethylallyltransferase MiaA [Candidatus Gracilibacteria bacterium]|nr:MAG: tRNA (adenosine(37)-N6)-dimethylallyltransferase MiaA [Candidatus Gracilibacteria bacterium]